ncbi:MAG: FtsX-like permease family protein [Methylobacter sp.]|nr:FtsX-like permease family protein [Methylobacter sp.]MDP2098880.1 FtsX-like permease family protein [Methylobacter sp.]MDP2428682.1 FtsX-like permease family protein [Methylobacter sp.]MDP3053161.1 FtsX-like permease family protein [Methylobacter sp.]MDP3361983.1 FtsX-like permease family protein [Methylobacter sp.]
MNRFNLALRLLWRDSRSGELTILVLALIIAVTSSTAIALFADRLQRTMTTQAAEFLAADLVIASPTRITADWLYKAAQLQLAQAQTLEFSSVLMEHDGLLLASIKAVSAAYPLRGFLKTTGADAALESIEYSGPKPGSAWVEKRILSALKLQLGDALTVGEKQLSISRILTYEPDKRGDFYSFSPRVMINSDDLPATGILQPGSHVHYFFQFSGDSKALSQFSRWLKPQLNPSQRIMDIHEDRPELGSALERAERYLGLSSIIVILISGVAIAMATRRYTERHFNATAILRCLGCKQNEILWLYGSQFVVLGLIASAIGCVLGWFTQLALFHLLKAFLPQQLANPGLLAVFFGFIIGMAILLGFALPPLLRLKKVSPLRVLRRELEPMPSSAWLIYGLAIAIVGVLIWRYTDDLKLTVTIIGVGLGTLLLLGLTVYGLLRFSRKLLPHLGLTWRFGLQGLLKNSRGSASQILAFSITLVAMVLSFSVRTELIDNWQKQLPDNAPNHFALNIFPEQQAAFAQDLQQHQISGSRFYPVVRGRLVEINNSPVQQVVSKDSQGERATQRELSLTWADELPEDNKISAGHWRQNAPVGEVSIERKLADSLKIKLADQLTFTIGSQQVSARVTSIRELNWDTMRPNFYMIFSPGTLDAFPSTFITSFYLPGQQKELLNTLVKKYPSITVLEVDLILQQIKTILRQLTEAINYLLYFALMAGFTVLFAAVYATLDSRIHEGALMRTLGARRGFLRATQLIEFSLLGLISGLLAVVIAEIMLYALYTHVMHIDYHATVYLWAIVPVIGAVSVGLAGCWGVRHVVNKSPLQVLREL